MDHPRPTMGGAGARGPCNNSCTCCGFTQRLLRVQYEQILVLTAELEDLQMAKSTCEMLERGYADEDEDLTGDG